MTSVLSTHPVSGKTPQYGNVNPEFAGEMESSSEARPKDQTQTAGFPDSIASDRILFLDDDPGRAQVFLDRYPEAVWVRTAAECIARLSEVWDQVHLDHDLEGEIYVDSSRHDCGMEVIRWLCSQPHRSHSRTCFYIHTHNVEAAVLMVESLRRLGYQAVYQPFGVNLAAGSSAQSTIEPCERRPLRVRLALSLRSWLNRRLKRVRWVAAEQSNAAPPELSGKDMSWGSCNSGAENASDRVPPQG
jgi:hypothetical protein